MPHRHLALLTTLIVAATAALAGRAMAQAPSLDWWSFPGGGDALRVTGAYRLSGAIGQPAAAPLTGGVYSVSAGVWVYPAGGVLAVPPGSPLPTSLELAPLAPNPSATSTSVAFAIPARGRVTAEVFDVRGERVATLVDEVRDAGRYRETWSGADARGHRVGAGVYFVRVRTSAGERTRRLVRLD